jgi:ATP-dependent RNA helicase HelY
VTAPTGAGKTLVAEAGVHLVLRRGLRAFYTTPIKALSNQKYGDFRRVYGDERVGLLTGDNVINSDAPLVVMTTEVLRNMIYAEAPALHDLGMVVLDEVHYLQDRYRGSVWEEVIIHLPAGIPLVNLSATVANAEEFTAWVRSRRGPTELVVETHRPVPLESWYAVKDRHHEGELLLLPVFGSGTRPNPRVERLLAKGRGRYRRFAPPRRVETIEVLQRERLLPAIYFIFSRAACEQAAELTAGAGLGLTTPVQRAEIRRVAEERTAHLGATDLAVLGYASWVGRLESGVAAHHAGMVPGFKETVEELFAAGLVRVVFATETLALGINMPARTVVLERLSKFTGESHEVMAPGDYTQLTGRAGRRGIDTLGTAVVLHQSDIPFDRVAAIAGLGSHPLQSSFQPSYNMAVNLVANYSPDLADELLSASFAQFRADSARAGLADSVEAKTAELAEMHLSAECDRGDLWTYLDARGAGAADPGAAVRALAQQTAAGDVLRLSADDADRWVVLARGWGANPRLVVMGASGETRRISAGDLAPTIAILGAVALPEPVRSRDPAYLAEAVHLLTSFRADVSPILPGADDADPVAGCPQLSEHLAWVRRAERVERDLRRLLRRLEQPGDSLVTRFHAVLELLEVWGYTAGWSLTDKGERLRFVYNEMDLLLTESVVSGHLDDLGPGDLAAVISMFTYEARLNDAIGAAPNVEVERRTDRIMDVWARLAKAESRLGLPETRAPDSGFAAMAHAWVAGVELEDLFDGDLAAGDFVRNCRQLLDLLRQVRDGFPALRTSAAAAIARIDRGVVVAGGRL